MKTYQVAGVGGRGHVDTGVGHLCPVGVCHAKRKEIKNFYQPILILYKFNNIYNPRCNLTYPYLYPNLA